MIEPIPLNKREQQYLAHLGKKIQTAQEAINEADAQQKAFAMCILERAGAPDHAFQLSQDGTELIPVPTPEPPKKD